VSLLTSRLLATVGGIADATRDRRVAVALSGSAGPPRLPARREIKLTPPPGLLTQPYHATADLDLAAPDR
jgi:hypothetical protein